MPEIIDSPNRRVEGARFSPAALLAGSGRVSRPPVHEKRVALHV